MLKALKLFWKFTKIRGEQKWAEGVLASLLSIFAHTRLPVVSLLPLLLTWFVEVEEQYSNFGGLSSLSY